MAAETLVRATTVLQQCYISVIAVVYQYNVTAVLHYSSVTLQQCSKCRECSDVDSGGGQQGAATA